MDNTKQARMSYVHSDPFNKKQKKRKQRLGNQKLLDQVQKEKYPKKEHMIDDNNNDINGK